MSHIDEGALHAYLDGALDEYPAAEARWVREHLDTCGECADRLAAERRVRERADEILALAAPRVEAPTFEELRAYVRRSQGVSRVSVRLYRIGWAASVVLALGTGWLLRGQPMGPVVAPLGAPPAESVVEAATEASTRESVAAEPAPSVTAEPSSFERVEQAASPPAGLARLEARAEFADAGRGASPWPARATRCSTQSTRSRPEYPPPASRRSATMSRPTCSRVSRVARHRRRQHPRRRRPPPRIGRPSRPPRSRR